MRVEVAVALVVILVRLMLAVDVGWFIGAVFFD
jgi:hypothetical protein